jgi:omega-amidase
MRMTFTLCSAQICSSWEKPELNLQKAAVMTERAVDEGASLIVFPEQFATGWDPLAESYVQDINGKIPATLKKLARKHSIGIIGAFREQHEPQPRNTCIAIGPDGSVLAKYAKIHLFSPEKENIAFSPGEKLATFSLEDMTFGIAICYDLRFWDLFSIYAEMGVECMVVPSAWPCRRIEHFKVFIRARALENQYYTAGINTVGPTPVDTYCGGSLVADPNGEVLSLESGKEECIFTSLDKMKIEEARTRMPILSDRREDLYKKLLYKNNWK